jgi:hypothetical protein
MTPSEMAIFSRNDGGPDDPATIPVNIMNESYSKIVVDNAIPVVSFVSKPQKEKSELYASVKRI